GAQGGIWTHFSSPAGFTVEFLPPPVGLDGSLLAGVGQEWQPHPWVPNGSNPIDGVWQAVWTPPTYTPRQVAILMQTWSPPFGPPPAPSSMYVFDGTDYLMADATAVWDSVHFPVVP